MGRDRPAPLRAKAPGCKLTHYPLGYWAGVVFAATDSLKHGTGYVERHHLCPAMAAGVTDDLWSLK
jgi:hypothetical protein